jgi:hypothetical protein
MNPQGTGEGGRESGILLLDGSLEPLPVHPRDRQAQ